MLFARHIEPDRDLSPTQQNPNWMKSMQSETIKSGNSVKRRQFLQATGAGALAVGVWSDVSAQESKSPNEKLKVLCVGTANRAFTDIRGVESQDIVGLCDVDQIYLDRASKQFPDAKLYKDYREMIAEEADRADAIVVATTDHNHAPAAIHGINAGLHCYCEKPLTHTVEEARKIAAAATSKGVATQMGTQIHAGENYRRVVEIIRAGTIGDVKEVHVWVGKGWGGGDRPKKVAKPQVNLTWDLWLGPAPERPFAPGRYHPKQWRRWWDFGQGTLGDMGCHYMDLPFWALDLRHPTSIEAEGSELHPETCPLGLVVKYKFPARGDMPALDLTWYDGNKAPRLVAGEKVPLNGVMFVGTEGLCRPPMETTNCSRKISTPIASHPHRPFRGRSGTMQSGLRLVRMVHLPPATLITPAHLLSQCC